MLFRRRVDSLDKFGEERSMIYFEDLEIGAETYFGSYHVTREEVIEFARKYDPQPFHVSDEAAAKTHFGRLAASGWHTAAMTMAVIARHVVEEQQAGLGSPGVDELRWKKPVYPGDTLHVRGKIIDKRPSRSRPEMGSFRSHTTVTNQDGLEVMSFEPIVLIRRRPAAGQ
jgi:acyl dehydratase